jgi:YfiR/HmsC-like
MDGRGKLGRLLCMAVSLGLIAPVAAPAASQPLEYQVKAGFLLNFTKFIEWPPAAFGAADSPLTICILGDDPFGNTLDQVVAGEVVNGRKLMVQRIKQPPASNSCQVVFVSKSETEVSKTLSAMGTGVLTIGEGEDFIREGGMVAFQLENRKVRFGISKTKAENAGLKLSSKLLNVAKSVEQ